MELNGWLLFVVLAVEIANICLLIGLLSIYWGSYKQLKSKFTIGLLFFASTFLIKSVLFVAGLLILSLGGFHWVPDGGSDHAPSFLFLLNAIECVALAILLKITWE